MAEDKLIELLKPTNGEQLQNRLLLLLKVVNLPLPVNLGEIANAVIGEPAQKRLEVFVRLIAEQIQKLADKVEKLDFDNPAFQSTCIHAAEIVLRTHLEEKRQLLCNAVLNSAIQSELPEEMQRQIYMDLLEKLTPTHIKVLRLFASQKLAHVHIELGDPNWINVINYVDPMHEVFDKELPETIGHENLRLRFVNDLFAEALIANIFPERESLSEIAYSPKPTQLAKGFLKFVESPLNIS